MMKMTMKKLLFAGLASLTMVSVFAPTTAAAHNCHSGATNYSDHSNHSSSYCLKYCYYVDADKDGYCDYFCDENEDGVCDHCLDKKAPKKTTKTTKTTKTAKASTTKKSTTSKKTTTSHHSSHH